MLAEISLPQLTHLGENRRAAFCGTTKGRLRRWRLKQRALVFPTDQYRGTYGRENAKSLASERSRKKASSRRRGRDFRSEIDLRLEQEKLTLPFKSVPLFRFIYSWRGNIIFSFLSLETGKALIDLSDGIRFPAVENKHCLRAPAAAGRGWRRRGAPGAPPIRCPPRLCRSNKAFYRPADQGRVSGKLCEAWKRKPDSAVRLA